ncbi:hypothetical protein M2282_002275 [Variovorax boronicumulans]|uniref:SAVED domain-containing protein n=1 Tax=Variovorax boronicumulans TaxID=436515 RepID=UPI002476FEC5|nr:SAVED domain-containing protein [Variovorax boronicumulans]MDH6167126.1 hypothetical protein [Variovorax boronicumulans]
MANAVEAGWHGHDYQARFFWIHASALRDPEKTHVVEVSYEADGPKAFDDVIVRYDPPRVSMSSRRVSVDFHQIKYHVTLGGSFGYEDLVNPAFVGATKFSVLERLKQAKSTASAHSAFTLVTVDAFKTGDPLGSIVSSKDFSLRMDKLFDGTTDRSAMGKVRKLWREHLGLSKDEDLRAVLEGFHITSSQRSLEQLRDEVNLHFRLVGLVSCNNTVEFRFDAAARALKSSGRSTFSRLDFEALCREEGWIRSVRDDKYLNVAIRSFGDGPGNRLDATPENTLSLQHLFDERHPHSQQDWAAVVQPKIVEFLKGVRQRAHEVRLFLDAHASIAFLAGSVLGLKSAVKVELIQKGRAGVSTWRSDDGVTGAEAKISIERLGDGDETALVVSLARSAVRDAREYMVLHLPAVGTLVHLESQTPAGPRTVAGGEHAATLADQAAEAVRGFGRSGGKPVHVFAAAPNGFMFFLGQHREAMGPVILYEFDFGRSLSGSYVPAYAIC